MTEREKMLAGQLYDCGDAELLAQWHRAKDLVRDYNQTDSANAREKERLLSKLLGGKGKNDRSDVRKTVPEKSKLQEGVPEEGG